MCTGTRRSFLRARRGGERVKLLPLRKKMKIKETPDPDALYCICSSRDARESDSGSEEESATTHRWCSSTPSARLLHLW